MVGIMPEEEAGVPRGLGRGHVGNSVRPVQRVQPGEGLTLSSRPYRPPPPPPIPTCSESSSSGSPGSLMAAPRAALSTCSHRKSSGNPPPSQTTPSWSPSPLLPLPPLHAPLATSPPASVSHA